MTAYDPLHLLCRLVVEIDFVTSGGNDPHERCPDCGLAGVGMMRDARREAVDYLITQGVVEQMPDGRIRRKMGGGR